MRVLTLLLVLSLAAAPLAHAQKGSIEIGTKAGVSLAIPGGGDTEVYIALPGTGALVLPSIYATFWATPALMIEPQVLFSWNSATEEAWFSGVLQGGWMFSPQKRNSAYVAADFGWLTLGGDIESALAGGGAGYRFRVGDGAGLRLEALYRRWLCDGCDLNEIIFAFGGGVVF
ncbi:MAG: hypothetical protein JSW43_04425 [Gemmatimonadota bacterium]|nr:MAG: hypothetical protein JSW43_04425 [Gemmatimonadota bacterium]